MILEILFSSHFSGGEHFFPPFLFWEKKKGGGGDLHIELKFAFGIYGPDKN